MESIINQPYYKVEREISTDGQFHAVDHRTMYLYPNKIVTKYREFSLIDVFDLSYRRIGREGGLLYLHTRNGIYPYMVEEEPAAFIQTFKNLVTDHCSRVKRKV